ncbi:MAG TPA: MFS transporter [Candidatus Dormibacteraeota bacterium]|nr:MFS transporter [Candidatus Dormibacteraeota bacterium]
MGGALQTPPSGSQDGRTAWVVVAAAFVSMFAVFGVVYSFGVFFDPMAREFGTGRGLTSVVFAVTAFLFFVLGAMTGPVADRIGPRRVVLVGAGATGGGLILTAAVPSIWLGYLTFGLGVGLGTACGYVPMVAAVGGWFERRRALAIGIAVSGIGVGTLAVPPAAALLVGALGWRRTYLVFGVAALLLLSACALAATTPPPSPKRTRHLGRVVRTWEFAELYCCGLLSSFALFLAFVHIVPYAIRLGSAPVAAAGLVSVIGVGSTAGRLGLGGAAERLGAVRTFQLSVGILIASYVLWYLAPGYLALAGFALVLGLGYGGWVALSPSVMADLFGWEGLGGSLGLLYTSAGVGALFGPPFAGFLVDATNSYRPAILTALSLAAAAGLAIARLPVCRVTSDAEAEVETRRRVS